MSRIGTDTRLDEGTCGKEGQGVPVGQPTMLIDALTVGETAVQEATKYKPLSKSTRK